jgi:hypothetical protein
LDGFEEQSADLRAEATSVCPVFGTILPTDVKNRGSP